MCTMVMEFASVSQNCPIGRKFSQCVVCDFDSLADLIMAELHLVNKKKTKQYILHIFLSKYHAKWLPVLSQMEQALIHGKL